MKNIIILTTLTILFTGCINTNPTPEIKVNNVIHTTNEYTDYDKTPISDNTKPSWSNIKIDNNKFITTIAKSTKSGSYNEVLYSALGNAGLSFKQKLQKRINLMNKDIIENMPYSVSKINLFYGVIDTILSYSLNENSIIDIKLNQDNSVEIYVFLSKDMVADILYEEALKKLKDNNILLSDNQKIILKESIFKYV